MSGENVALARNAYQLVAKNGFAAARDFLHPEIEVFPPADVPEAGSFRGKEAAIERYELLAAPFDDLRVEPREFIDVDADTIVVVLRVAGRGSGAAVEGEVVHVLTVRDGKALQMRVFMDRAEALESLELHRRQRD
jgi:ketosteroid isomerase-like protein